MGKVIIEDLLAGNYIFTLYSTKWDCRYTYKIKADKQHIWYKCFVLYGPDNEQDYRFIGVFHLSSLALGCVSKQKETGKLWSDTKPYKMLKQFLQIAYSNEDLPDTCVFYPSGRCYKCGRLLTTIESIDRGFGPKCWNMIKE